MNASTTPDRIEQIDIESLAPYANNSRTHSAEQVQQVASSIREFGFTNPVLIDAVGGIIAGHGRVLAAKSIGMLKVPCIRLSHLSDAQRRAYVIADNKLALNAGWDDAILSRELDELRDCEFDLDLTGFNDDEIAELIATTNVTSRTGPDPDTVPEVQAVATTRKGDIWECGRHRIICGDSTDQLVYQSLLGGTSVDVVWTDPPYNVDYKTAAGKIANDNLADAAFLEFLTKLFGCVAASMKHGAPIYVAHADTEGLNFRLAFKAAGLKLSGVVVWRKDALVLGRSDYQWIHEPVLYGWKPGAAHKWYGGRKQTTVSEAGASGSPFVPMRDGRWQVTIGEEIMVVSGEATVDYVEHSVLRELRPRRSDLHPTMKPVALIERMLKNSAKPGAVVLDVCGGSGSTLIAAQTLGMSARVIELSPIYCDVIIRRWQEFTGLVAVLMGDGRAFDELVDARA